MTMMEQSRDKLSNIRENRESLLSSSQTELTEMEHLVERVEMEERRVQEMMLELNNQYNKVGFFFVTLQLTFYVAKINKGISGNGMVALNLFWDMRDLIQFSTKRHCTLKY